MTPDDISVVIPAINEEANICRAVQSALDADAGEVVVVDGGSHDQTVKVATESGAHKIVHSLPGRGIQLNSGALVCERELLLFLHADNRLDRNCLQQICDRDAEVRDGDLWGAFRQRIDSSRKIFRVIEWGNALRVTLRRVPFGDQAIFVRRQQFQQSGGFAEVPLMEDVEFSKRMRKKSRPALLDGPVTVSSRRWQQNGVVRQTLRNWSIQIAYACGTSPEKLKQRYS